MDLNAWIEKEFSGHGVAVRRQDEPAIPGEPFMSMEEAKTLARRAVAIFAEQNPKWECAARKQSLPEPADCNWPVCGCDPYADKVIDALQEAGQIADALRS